MPSGVATSVTQVSRFLALQKRFAKARLLPGWWEGAAFCTPHIYCQAAGSAAKLPSLTFSGSSGSHQASASASALPPAAAAPRCAAASRQRG